MYEKIFDFTLRWDNVSVLDLNQRGSKFPRELVFFNVLDEAFYYRSTPYNDSYTHYESQGSNTITPSDPNAIGYDGKSPNQRYLEKSTGFYGVRKPLSIILLNLKIVDYIY
mgnify:CR=1 FL=1